MLSDLVNVILTSRGESYAQAVIAVIERLNRDIGERVDPAQLSAADAVLRAVLADEHTRRRAAYLPRPLAPPGDSPP